MPGVGIRCFFFQKGYPRQCEPYSARFFDLSEAKDAIREGRYFHNSVGMRTKRRLFLRNHGKRLVRRPCTFLKKLQKDREITDFTVFSGGDEGDRTLDLTDANRTLSQLSYAPKLWKIYNFQNSRYARRRTQWACSADSLLSQLSYGPTYEIIPRPGQRYILYHKIRHGQGQFSILCKLRKKHRRIVRRCFFPAQPT